MTMTISQERLSQSEQIVISKANQLINDFTNHDNILRSFNDNMCYFNPLVISDNVFDRFKIYLLAVTPSDCKPLILFSSVLDTYNDKIKKCCYDLIDYIRKNIHDAHIKTYDKHLHNIISKKFKDFDNHLDKQPRFGEIDLFIKDTQACERFIICNNTNTIYCYATLYEYVINKYMLDRINVKFTRDNIPNITNVQLYQQQKAYRSSDNIPTSSIYQLESLAYENEPTLKQLCDNIQSGTLCLVPSLCR